MNRFAAFAMLLIAALISSPAQAHLMPKQSGTMKIVDNSANFVVSVPVGAFDGVDRDGNGELSPDELGKGQKQIADQFEARFHVSSKGAQGKQALTWVLSPHTDGSDTAIDYVVVMHRVFFAAPPQNPTVATDLFGPQADARQLSLRATHGDESEIAVFTPNQPRHSFFVSRWAIFKDFVTLGVEHILTGFDHLLFLLTIVVAGAGVRYWISVISSFTVAHSITLALGSLHWIDVPAAVVEPAIALSIVTLAVLNLWQIRRDQLFGLKTKSAIVFGCGLLHGMGFAGAIGEMELSAQNWLATVAGFNIGIELGQFTFVGVTILGSFALARLGQQKWRKPLSILACLVAAVIGSGLFVERLIGA